MKRARADRQARSGAFSLALFALSLCFLLAISLLSEYEFNELAARQSLAAFLLLTPYAIFTNRVLDAPGPQIYGRLCSEFRSGFLSQPELIVLYIVLAGVALAQLSRLRGSKS